MNYSHFSESGLSNEKWRKREAYNRFFFKAGYRLLCFLKPKFNFCREFKFSTWFCVEYLVSENLCCWCCSLGGQQDWKQRFLHPSFSVSTQRLFTASVAGGSWAQSLPKLCLYWQVSVMPTPYFSFRASLKTKFTFPQF